MTENQLPEILHHLNNNKTEGNEQSSSKYRYRKSLINKKYDWINQSLLPEPQHSALHQFIKISLGNNLAVFKKRNLTEISNTTNDIHMKDFNRPNRKVFIYNYTPTKKKQSCSSDLRTCKSLLNTKIARDSTKLQNLQKYKKQQMKTNLMHKYNHNSACDLNQKGYHSCNLSKFQREDFELNPWKSDAEFNQKQNEEFGH